MQGSSVNLPMKKHRNGWMTRVEQTIKEIATNTILLKTVPNKNTTTKVGHTNVSFFFFFLKGFEQKGF